MAEAGSEIEASTSNERNYVVPVRSVKSVNDMAFWEKSTAYYDIIGFINAISQAIQGKKLSTKVDASPIADNLVQVFEVLNKLVDETPPLEQPQRFGNKAYREWFEKMKIQSPDLLKRALPAEFHPALIEVAEYFTESFGNATRIDYGTGHELTFIMFLCALYKIHALTESDNLHTGLKIFNEYLLFVRRLQLTYRMEPAGSHGVWSLDDYQYVPFIWGSAQLAVNAPFEPHHFLEPDVIDRYKNEYYFIGCIDYILQVKTGSFAEHSNQLWSISSVDSWVKINSGLVKKYQKELLAKFPVIQHVLFGSILEFKRIKEGTILPTARLGMLPPRRAPAPPSSTSTAPPTAPSS
ncbi:serine/threonine-protein phosphatase 2A activator [Contarinia nasturtii]|uniref:serine/threonine-protein phosphatase 2A activator n=1 Tax=Contarinia nasturtii TaxID=265458 RepID=UPI0012D3BA3B|nr:serine/threonine-protein phosphatase 2A activator [Contarinia nasturtii]